jgi:hypothetical protein
LFSSYVYWRFFGTIREDSYLDKSSYKKVITHVKKKGMEEYEDVEVSLYYFLKKKKLILFSLLSQVR